MSDKDSAQNVIEAYRRRQSLAHKAPLIFGIAALFLIVGSGILIFWLTNPKTPSISLFKPSETATATSTVTTTSTSLPTHTPTDTSTPEPTLTSTVTETPTPSMPFVYKVQEDDLGLSMIAEKFNTTIDLILALNPAIDPKTLIIYVGQEIIIPAPDTTLPTATPIPPGWIGTIDYIVQKGDTLYSIAEKFNSTVESILALNKDKIKDANDVPYGLLIKVKVNIVTPRPTPTQGTVYPTAPVPATNTPTP